MYNLNWLLYSVHGRLHILEIVLLHLTQFCFWRGNIYSRRNCDIWRKKFKGQKIDKEASLDPPQPNSTSMQSSFLCQPAILHCCNQSVTNTFFLFDLIRIPNIIWFLEITKYQILSSIGYWENLNTEYHLYLRKYKYWIWIVLLGLTIQVLNT